MHQPRACSLALSLGVCVRSVCVSYLSVLYASAACLFPNFIPGCVSVSVFVSVLYASPACLLVPNETLT